MAIIVKACMNDCNYSINNGNEEHYLNIIPIICFADISRIFICPHSRFADEVFDGGKKILVSPNYSIDNVGWLLQNPLTKLPSLRFCGHQLRVELKCNAKNGIDDYVQRSSTT